jgi:hypothetical protein
MKKLLFTAAIVGLTAFAAMAQDFSGSWKLDVSKSKLDERQRIESMSMNVTQTTADIKVETQTKRLPPPADGQGGGRGMGGGFGGGDSTMTYTLDGKESQIQQDTPRGPMPVAIKAKMDGGKLKLSQARTFSGPMGEITMTTRETWTLSEDGKTLTVNRESESPRGTNSSEMVFVKQ